LDETGRIAQSERRMVPSNQRLHGDDVQVGEGHERLVVYLELVEVEGTPELPLVINIGVTRFARGCGSCPIDRGDGNGLAGFVAYRRGASWHAD
ncbi:MAG TPA: hypothetical protein VNO51_18235, partial [Ilumatobacteraceae bacterium]|nr:hypothetical protein [Ilumatobacteraceae bacterium]